MLPVVENLHLGAAVPGGAIGLGHAIHDAAVAAGGNLPFKFQFEVGVGLFGDDIPAPACDGFDGVAINHPDLAWERLLLVAAERIRRFAIEDNGPLLCW